MSAYRLEYVMYEYIKASTKQMEQNARQEKNAVKFSRLTNKRREEKNCTYITWLDYIPV